MDFGTGEIMKNNEQVGGTHYLNMPIQPWEAIKAWRGKEAFIEYLYGEVISYIARAGHKGAALEDLQKAQHVLSVLIDEMNQPNPESVLESEEPEFDDFDENIDDHTDSEYETYLSECINDSEEIA